MAERLKQQRRVGDEGLLLVNPCSERKNLHSMEDDGISKVSLG
jgi:hypothetical protein